jgi:hypothetical protein
LDSRHGGVAQSLLTHSGRDKAVGTYVISS